VLSFRSCRKADLGPVKYLATLLGADIGTALRWFALVVAFLLDPAAVLLLLAATVFLPVR
jgi:Na+/phosphate symporter